MMFLHPRVNERFEFTDGGEETIAGRMLRKAIYKRSGAADVDQDDARPRPGADRHDLDRSVHRHGGEDRAERRRSGRALPGDRDVPPRRGARHVGARQDGGVLQGLRGLDDILATATYTNVRRILKSELER